MATLATNQVRWDERIARARRLADQHAAAAEFLIFYAALAEYQRSLAARWAAAIEDQPSADSLLGSLDAGVVLEAVPDFLSWLERTAPARLVDAVTETHRLNPSGWHVHLDAYLANLGSDTDPAHAPTVFVLETLLQPLAEQLATRRSRAGPHVVGAGFSRPDGTSIRGANRCPFCDSLPVVGVLREEAEGAKRRLVCGLCLTEWNYLRLVCPSCGEHGFDALPVYTAEQFRNTRLEVCDTCRTYLKTIDATKDGLAVPLVDDIASISLDLWAGDQGYVRLRSNLLRV